MKPCNKCGKKFEAEGPFNRTCPKCTNENRYVSRRGSKVGNYEPNIYQAFNESPSNENILLQQILSRK